MNNKYYQGIVQKKTHYITKRPGVYDCRYFGIGLDHNVILQKYEVMFSEFMETAQSNEGLR